MAKDDINIDIKMNAIGDEEWQKIGVALGFDAAIGEDATVVEPKADLSQIAADLAKLPKVEPKAGLTFSGTTAKISTTDHTDSSSPLMSHVDFAKLAAKMYGVPPHMAAYTHTFEPDHGIGHGNAVVDALWTATYALAKQIKQDGITKPLTLIAPVASEHKYLVNAPSLDGIIIKKLVVTVKLEE